MQAGDADQQVGPDPAGNPQWKRAAQMRSGLLGLFGLFV
jgi:hypothetical protein